LSLTLMSARLIFGEVIKSFYGSGEQLIAIATSRQIVENHDGFATGKKRIPTRNRNRSSAHQNSPQTPYAFQGDGENTENRRRSRTNEERLEKKIEFSCCESCFVLYPT